MRRVLLPALIGAVLFIGFLIAGMPARLIFDLALRPAGVEAGQVQGRVWDAQLVRIRAGDMSIAEARARLAPASLLGFSARFDVTLADPSIRGVGVVTLQSGGLRIQGADGVVRLDQLASELAYMAPDAVLQLDVDTLAFDAEGRCQSAEGHALTPALATLGERYGVELPVLRLELMCLGDTLGADLSGASDVVAFNGRLRIQPAGLQGRIVATSSQRDVIAALSFAGFEQSDQSTYVLTLPLPEEA